MSTAARGRRAPVAMGPAMALALSWKPLVKSKTSAATTTMMTITGMSMRCALTSTRLLSDHLRADKVASPHPGRAIAGQWSSDEMTAELTSASSATSSTATSRTKSMPCCSASLATSC